MKTKQRPQEPHDKVPETVLNDVGDVLNQIAPYWRTIVAIVVVAITGVGLFSFISNSRTKAEEASWEAYFAAIDANNPQALDELAQNSGGAVVPWAYHAAAQGRLAEGMQNLYVDREQARSALEEAVVGFNSAVETSVNIDLLNQRSLWGLAQANEGLNELEKAKTAYQKLLDRWPESPLAKRAQARITDLNSPETQEFYRWFFEQKPVASTGSVFDSSPADPFTIPDEPDLSIPDLNPPGGAVNDPGLDVPAAPSNGADADATTAEPVSTDLDDIIDDSASNESSDSESTEGPADTSSPEAPADGNDDEITEVIESDDDAPVEVAPDP